MSKFWGLTVNVGKKFKQQVKESFCISGAALEPLDLSSGKYDEKPVLLYLQQGQNDYLLCSLSPKQSLLQVALNVRIGSGETVGFHLRGGSQKSKVHLTGFTLAREDILSSTSPGGLVPTKGQQKSILVTESKSADKQKKRVSIVETEPYGEIEEIESDPEQRTLGVSGIDATKKLFNGNADDDSDEDDDDYEEEDDDSDSDLQDDELEELQQLVQKGKYNPQTGGKLGEDEDSDDLEMLDDEEDDDDDDDDDDEDEDDSDDGLGLASPKKLAEQKSDAKSLQKQKQTGSSPNTSTNKDKKGDPNNLNKNTPKTPTADNKQLNNLKVKTPSSAGHTPMKSFSKGGVLVNDVKIGSGQQAKAGKMVTVYYEGRLKSNNKRFDATQNGPGFKFRLGKGEVIKGWDLGVDGMKIGGKRKLVIPAQLAYGKRGAPPDIPPNSTLVFDVELKNVS